MNDDTIREHRQPYLRGGAHAPLSAAEVETKFRDNAKYGGWPADTAERFLEFSQALFSARRLDRLQDFRA
jgi:hypothetical protein